ncbi:MAG: hypothetical protein OXF93_18790 [Acidobacteria bacterium]|nr:hypothetical protein [Acidobacteriota bacterium]
MDLPLWAWGIVGGAGAELLRWFRVRDQPAPDWGRRPLYWVVTVLMIAFGALLVLMYEGSGVALNPPLAVNIGASAPLALSAVTGQLPSPARFD